jgi:hypothetical protein
MCSLHPAQVTANCFDEKCIDAWGDGPVLLLLTILFWLRLEVK